jgi:hypothetical protein
MKQNTLSMTLNMHNPPNRLKVVRTLCRRAGDSAGGDSIPHYSKHHMVSRNPYCLIVKNCPETLGMSTKTLSLRGVLMRFYMLRSHL